MKYLVLVVPFLALTSPLLSQSVSCTTVQRTQTTTCTASGGTNYTNWTFIGANGGTVTRTPSTDSPTWSGVAVQSGQVSVTVTTANGAKVVHGFLIVSSRPVANFSLTATPAMQKSPGYLCSTDSNLDLPSPPTTSGSGEGVLGKYCELDGYSYPISVVSGGPNDGYAFLPSFTSDTHFYWAYSSDLADTSSRFYKAQCGNYNATSNPSGYISGSQLALNTINHESGATKSHYSQWISALNNSAINPGTRLEAFAEQVSNQQQFQQDLNNAIAPNLSTLSSTTTAEPCTQGVSDDSTCTFRGFVNYMDGNGNYASCPQ